jgi:molybdenum cofactor cytidylyltransferase
VPDVSSASTRAPRSTWVINRLSNPWLARKAPLISAIVLAAGMSTRMGAENKLLLPFRGTTLIGNMVDVVAGAQVGETLVVLGHEAERVRAAVLARPGRSGGPVIFVDNPNYAEGMGSSVQAGMRAVSVRATGIMVCLTDLPLIESAELNQLIKAFEMQLNAEPPIAVPIHQGQRGNPVLFSAKYRDEALSMRGMAGCRGIVKKYPERVIEVEMVEDHVLLDIDTVEDYRRLVAVEGSSAAD